jgi:EAL domain-containing protein (putative c-di-GMP-specific phosphodiesterase class I)
VVLARTINLIKECGAEVVIEGVEDRAEANLAIDAGADYVQGFFFARPSQSDMPPGLTASMFASLGECEPPATRTGSFARLTV